MPVNAILSQTEVLMKKTVNRMHDEFSNIRTGRATASILDVVRVNFYGSQVPVSQVGTIAVTEARTIEIRPWDVSVMGELEKSILGANLGVTPNNDGKIMRLVFPPLSEDRRKDLVKVVKKLTEEYRVSLRNERRDAMEKIKKEEKDEGLPQDLRKKAESQIQGLTNSFIKVIDESLEIKEKEILEI